MYQLHKYVDTISRVEFTFTRTLLMGGWAGRRVENAEEIIAALGHVHY